MMMSEKKKSITRREFISKSIKGAGLVGLGGAIGLTASRLLTDRAGSKPGKIVSAFDDDLKKLSAVDPALIKYRETGKVKLGFQHLRAVAVDPDDRIYVVADKTIQVLSRDGALLSEVRLKDSPQCLFAAEDGNIYAGMRDRVEIYNPKGGLKSDWDSLGKNAVLTSVAVSGNDVFVADAGNRVVLRYDATGKLVRRIGERDEFRNIPGFIVPSPYFDLAVSSDGLLRVANPGQHRVEAYTFDGDFEFSWGNPSMAIDGFCGCCNPVNFAMLPDGRFVTCEKGLPRIKTYSAEGNFEGVVASPEVFAENARTCASADGLFNCRTGGMDIAVDSEGRVIVMDPVERVVRIFEQIVKA
jgi:DNA-binding beta-propeller fold protein YncE